MRLICTRPLSFASAVVLFTTFHMTTNAATVDHVDNTCVLQVTNESRALFTETIIRKRYNFVYMQLEFTDLNGTVKSQDNVLVPNRWVWTYRGEEGGYEYLFLPRDFGYMSFGLLWTKSTSDPFTIDLNHHGNCSGLTIGENKSDLLVGDALGSMTRELADKGDLYKSSYWCYSIALTDECKEPICTLQTHIEYRCCKLDISVFPKTKHIECSKQHYHISTIWSILPIVSGGILWAFYPLFIFMIITKCSIMSKSHTGIHYVPLNEENYTKYISLEHDAPITFMSTVLSPMQKISAFCTNRCSYGWDKCRRIPRLSFLLLSCTLPAIGIYLDSKYSSWLIKEAVARGVLVDFGSMISGNGRTGRFLNWLGGPYIALALYCAIVTIFLVLPDNLGTCLEKGLFDYEYTQYETPCSIFTISLEDRVKLGGISVRNSKRFKKMYKHLLIQLYLILNWRFWRKCWYIFKDRWKYFVPLKLLKWCLKLFFSLPDNACITVSFLILVYFLCICVGAFYSFICIIEFMLGVIYFNIPSFSCLFIIFNAYRFSTTTFLIDKMQTLKVKENCVPCCLSTNCLKCWKVVIVMIIFLPFLLSYSVNSVIVFNAFWLLSRMVMFTFMAIVQFPEISYGYIILILMSIYYFMQSVSDFGVTYRILLKTTIEISKKVQEEFDNEYAKEKLVHNNAVPQCMFEHIVDRHMPKRIQVFKTLIKAGTVIAIVGISIVSLIKFDKFQQLQPLSNIFTLIFISALPKLIGRLCVVRNRKKFRQTLRSKIHHTVKEFCKNRGFTNIELQDCEEDYDV